jgi:hypothetical protein
VYAGSIPTPASKKLNVVQVFRGQVRSLVQRKTSFPYVFRKDLQNGINREAQGPRRQIHLLRFDTQARPPPDLSKFDAHANAKALIPRTEANIAERKHFGMARVRTIEDLIGAFEPEAPKIKTAKDRTRAFSGWRKNFGAVLLQDFDAEMLMKARRQLASEKVTRVGTQNAAKAKPRSYSTIRFYLIVKGLNATRRPT